MHSLITNVSLILCVFVLHTEVMQRSMQFSLSLLSSTQGVDALREDETMVASQIKSKLSAQDAILFDELHNNLKDGVCNSIIF